MAERSLADYLIPLKLGWSDLASRVQLTSTQGVTYPNTSASTIPISLSNDSKDSGGASSQVIKDSDKPSESSSSPSPDNPLSEKVSDPTTLTNEMVGKESEEKTKTSENVEKEKEIELAPKLGSNDENSQTNSDSTIIKIKLTPAQNKFWKRITNSDGFVSRFKHADLSQPFEATSVLSL